MCSKVFTVHMSPALNGSSALSVVEIHNGVMFDFYLRQPHVYQAGTHSNHGVWLLISTASYAEGKSPFLCFVQLCTNIG